MYLRPRSTDLVVFHEIFCHRGYELPERAHAALSEQPVAIDAGANIGLFTLFLCDTAPETKVIAFEPDPENARIARLTLAGLIEAGQVELIEKAVGTRAWEIPFVAGLQMTSHRAGPDEHGRIRVQQVDLFEHLQDVGLLKLDIEGAEWEILRDPRWPQAMPASVVLEWHGLHETEPARQLERSFSTAEIFDHVQFVPDIVGHLWAFRQRPASNVQ